MRRKDGWGGKRAEEMRVNGWENDNRIGNGRERKENGKGVKGLE